ncbi:MAG: hypothetical protein DSM106950_26110 [Stigonema ocellatum SAG 48.90 = DSM 106950]|nr:hypothetical protein [Stigonema ocellatum SAG 48.90 = DSM 106950]
MIQANLRNQQIILLNLSLVTSILLLLLRGSFLPHSVQYTFLSTLLSLKGNHDIFSVQSICFLLLATFFIILSLLSVQYFLKGFQRYKYKALLPLLINIFTIIVLLVMHKVFILQDFYSHVGEREEIVTMIASGTLKQNDSQRIKWFDNLSNVLHKIYKVQLPSQYTHLSEGGERSGEINIITNHNNQTKIIVFFTSIDDFNYTAWLYKINPSTPIENYLFGVGNLKSYARLLQAKEVNDNWSWVDVVEN